MPIPQTPPRLPPLAASSSPRLSIRKGLARRWHRGIGLVSAVSLTYLLITGLPLQFSAELGLGKSYVTQGWIQDWYGVQAPQTAVASGPMTAVGDVFLYNNKPLASSDLGQRLLGAAAVGDFVAVLTDRWLLLLEPDSGALERLEPPSPGIAMAVEADQLLLRSAAGMYVTDDFDLWQIDTRAISEINWVNVQPLTGSSLIALQQRYRDGVITQERWLQDLHSGRFFGPIGVWLVTIATLLVLVLAATGLMLWWRSRR